MKTLFQFFMLAFGITWVLWTPLWLSMFGIQGVPEVPYHAELSGLGPMLAAVLIVWRKERITGVGHLMSRVVSPGPGPYWAIALVGPLFFIYTGWVECDDPIALSDLLGQFFSNLVFFGIGEEVGWRGFVLPRLQAKMNALTSSLVLFVPWALWHLPRFLSQHDHITRHIAVWCVALMAGSIIFTWLFNSSKGSILVTALFHSSYNVAHLYSGKGLLVLSVVLASIIIVLVFGSKDLSRRPRTVVLDDPSIVM